MSIQTAAAGTGEPYKDCSTSADGTMVVIDRDAGSFEIKLALEIEK